MTALADTLGLKQNTFSGITDTETCLRVIRHVTYFAHACIEALSAAPFHLHVTFAVT